MPVLATAVVLLVTGGCASIDRNALYEYRGHLAAERWQQALEQVQGEGLYSHKPSLLVKQLERATLLHLQGQYYRAQQIFDRARAHAERLYTTSISSAALQATLGESLGTYYGEIYEHSLLRFYSALNHYLISQQGYYESYTLDGQIHQRRELTPRERRRHLEAARAVTVEWNSKIRQWRGERAGRTVFKDDLLAKVFGAFVHRQVGGRSDSQTARLLLKDARRVLFQNYNAYPSFNLLGESFKRDFDQLPTLSRKQVEQQYVQATPQARALESYLTQQEKLSQPPNIAVVIHHGLIAAKRAKTYRFPLDLASHIKIIVTGEMTPVDFAIQVLGLVSDRGIPAIEFELPEIAPRAVTAQFTVEIARDQQVLATHPLPLINPLSDIAREAVQEQALATRLRLGVRLAAKHAAAITSAYAAYRTARRNGMADFAAQFLATGLYFAANKAITQSEQADLRAWMSLPHTLNMTSFSLPHGTYQVKLHKKEGGQTTTYPLPSLTLAKGQTHLLSTRIPQDSY